MSSIRHGPSGQAPFEDRGEIGRGGMSVVHQIYDPVLERLIALKVLSADRESERARARFLDEARIMGQLDHPNIVPVHTYELREDGHDAISMKLVQGQNFLERIRTQGETRLRHDNLTESLHILMKVCDAVAYAHSRGVVHRDLKPSNIMVGEFGQVYVMDWGIALRLDREERLAPPLPPLAGSGDGESSAHRGVLGTPTFIAPEQIDDPDGVDSRADVYALGGILYALLTGRAPHQGRTPMLRLMAANHGQIAPPESIVPEGLPSTLVRIAMRALARAPSDRYADVSALKAEIGSFLHGASSLEVRSYPDGALVVEEGALGNEAFVIASGSAVVTRDGRELRALVSGDVFGELAILSPRGVRTSSVRAQGELRVLVVTREMLAEGLGLNSWMGVFVQALAARFAELEARLAPPPG